MDFQFCATCFIQFLNFVLSKLLSIKIDGNFAPQETDLIKKIPLAWVESDDSIFLPWAKDGCYTCKSGYRFLKEE